MFQPQLRTLLRLLRLEMARDDTSVEVQKHSLHISHDLDAWHLSHRAVDLHHAPHDMHEHRGARCRASHQVLFLEDVRSSRPCYRHNPSRLLAAKVRTARRAVGDEAYGGTVRPVLRSQNAHSKLSAAQSNTMDFFVRQTYLSCDLAFHSSYLFLSCAWSLFEHNALSRTELSPCHCFTHCP